MTELHDLKGLQIVHINVRSLLSKIDTLRVDIIDSNIDVLCVTESWHHKGIGDIMVNIEGFQLCRNDRISGRGGGYMYLY